MKCKTCNDDIEKCNCGLKNVIAEKGNKHEQENE
jgi:hypothetical protein